MPDLDTPLSVPRRRRPSRRLAVVPLVLGLALVAAACSGGDAASGNADPTVSIAAPADGARVGRSFDVRMDLNFPIGEPDTGRQHIHLHYDGSPDYDIVYDDTHTVTLDPGEHTIVAVVANADHSETDAHSRAVTVEVSGAGTGAATTTTSGNRDY